MKKVIDFDGNCLAEVEFTDSSIKVLRAINGWGEKIEEEKIKITDSMEETK